MDGSDVLKEYLDLFTADCRQLKLLVAPNAVIDWFGRTVRGPAKIHDYFRFEVATQYDHMDFDKAESCAPIEQRPSHWKTKLLHTGDTDFVLPINKVTGLTSLKSYADSDIDDDDLQMQPLPAGNQTPEHNSSSIAHINELTPPSSTIKLEATATDSESEVDDPDSASAPKRLKRSLPTPFSYLRRLPTATTKTTHVSKRQLTASQLDMQMLGDDTSSDEELDADMRKKILSEYTSLQYIESTGFLRAKPQVLPHTDSPPTPHRMHDWDRPVRIRMSYRRSLSDQQLQVVLVIYEHVKSSGTDVIQGATAISMRRRNLMAQFNEAALSEPSPTTQEVTGDVEEIVATDVTTVVPLTDVGEDASAAVDTAHLRTPSKSGPTPPATPKRRPRVPYAMSGMKRIAPTPSTSTPKRSAARTLRL
ncbi:uncharacterized protein LOC118733116 [Rhagoletis pomonella]|uniref:uncharacterized protein LOC118733116 n=1 Tax=Rhagoletis pomonella TaxID=28610 RepID=UPI00177F4E86|nr:uncharacterized protein LOC118733116 [Rhagoletis pomonella]XP_036318237.1 uncharacterized protein LOC118733116 [Rhagoletis pomonella]